MESSKKRVAIIGGGVSGLTSIAACKEAGMEPVCFEKTDNFGGTWCYREDSEDGLSSIMASTVINISKELGSFSTFPPRKEFNNYMRHSEIYQYIVEYANAHDVLRHIRYHSQVTLVKRSEDYKVTGRWQVTVRNSLTGKETTEIFDGVMVCIGHLNWQKMPHFPQQETFEGKIMHTHSLKRVEEFQDKNVVVVGMGCSGLDAAVESSNVAKQVYLSTRSGAHIYNRLGPRGYPMDYVLIRRHFLLLKKTLPVKLTSWLIESLFLDPLFDHRLFAVKPKNHFLCQDPSVNDKIASKLQSGSVIQKPDIERFTENGVVFKGETQETEADVVIMATGYSWNYSFLEDGIVVQDGGKINLYKCVFPSHLQHGTLAIIGFLLPFGPGWPLFEMQARWVAHVISGKGKLPSIKVMNKEVEDRYSENAKRFSYNDKMTVRVDNLPYIEGIASEFGATPNLLKYLFTDFRLFLKLMFGPLVPYQYRLQGPHAWEGAREAIMTSEERTRWPLQKRKDDNDKEWFVVKCFKKILKMFVSY